MTGCVILIIRILLSASICPGIAAFKVNVTQLSGLLGGGALLRCFILPSSTAVAHVIWYKANPNYAICYYHGNNPKVNTGPLGVFKHRRISGRFVTDGGYHDLLIHKTILSDDDVYECEMLTEKYTKSSSSRIHLRLFSPPSQDPIVFHPDSNSIMESTNNCNDGTTIPVYKIPCNRSSIYIGCRTVGQYRPEPNISWELLPPHEVIMNASRMFPALGLTKSVIEINITLRNTSLILICRLQYEPRSTFVPSQDRVVCLKLDCALTKSSVQVNRWVIVSVVFAGFVIVVLLVTVGLYLKRRAAKEDNAQKSKTIQNANDDSSLLETSKDSNQSQDETNVTPEGENQGLMHWAKETAKGTVEAVKGRSKDLVVGTFVAAKETRVGKMVTTASSALRLDAVVTGALGLDLSDTKIADPSQTLSERDIATSNM